ncbi:MAG: MgtC/SapB family protein [Clostridia bacterium]|nr:MgtC/SapB family protein [Clostridia bacterium]
MEFNGFSLDVLISVGFRSLVAVIIGCLIGSERARHGRAAGMRTHIIVCLGAALTSMISLYVSEIMGNGGDVLRISAQVISGIGFLGAGMIILKSNNVITGLTTAAGVWTTSVIGIAVGYGFYEGALVVTVLFLVAIVLFAKLERRKKAAEIIYIEIDDMYLANQIVAQVKETLAVDFSHRMMAPKSNKEGNLGINIIINRRLNLNILSLKEIEHVVFVEEES